MHPALRTVPATVAATLCVLLALLTTTVAASATPAAPGRPPLTAVAGAGSAERAHTSLRADDPHAYGCPAEATAAYVHLGERPSVPDHHATIARTTGAAQAAGTFAAKSTCTATSPGTPLHDRNRAPPVPPGT
ncbi:MULTISPECIES: hypothetical protein [unclassified Streptomyces]|uniref:hypothetical protein n=1 Tax=unclassified Streptomyces TaxID=2593676 RepID=UPI002E2A2CCC|nr:hypothetical protein [Streptomyces sp. NBC_00273]